MTGITKNSFWLLTLPLLLTGCGRAPSVDVLGSFFPVWMLCLTIAIVLTFVLHYLLARFHIDTEVGPPALFYPCVVILFTSVFWLAFYR
jgi:YtcA family